MNLYQKYTVGKFYKTVPGKVFTQNIDWQKIKDKLLIMTVSYNNANVIRQQIRFVKKNIKDEYVYIIADNSSDKAKRSEIQILCKETNTGYISLPPNPFSTSSDSHAVALNWLFKNIVSVYQPAFFGFIDHDIYPVKPHSVTDLMAAQPFYGLIQQRENYWYLWPGLCFFKKEAYNNREFDFMPCVSNGIRLDTGGALCDILFHTFNKDSVKFPTQVYENIREGEVFQSDKIELIGNWLHSFNGSYWMQVKDKEDVLNKVLDNYYNNS
jgi:hypothetical protein